MNEYFIGWIMGLGFGFISGLIIALELLKPQLRHLEFRIQELKRDLRDTQIIMKIDERRQMENGKLVRRRSE